MTCHGWRGRLSHSLSSCCWRRKQWVAPYGRNPQCWVYKNCVAYETAWEKSDDLCLAL